MKARIKYIVFLFLYFILFFGFQKVVFLLYHYNQSSSLDFNKLLGIFTNGLIMDLSASTFGMIMPIIIITISPFISLKFERVSLKFCFYFFTITTGLIFISDLELYSHWGFRIDKTIFFYLTNPFSALASTSVWVILKLLLIGGSFAFTFIYFHNKYLLGILKVKNKKNTLQVLLFLILTGSLVIPIRGGLQIAPLNSGTVYFCENTFANHAALNSFWNLGYSLSTDSEENNSSNLSLKKYICDETNLSDTAYIPNRFQYIRKEIKPNILIIILESFTSKVIDFEKGKYSPFFNYWITQGIYFDNIYASGDRTDKGLAAVLSGYPSQPDYSILNFPEKTENLPKLSLDFKQQGYYTSFFYGGDINFAGMNSYVNQGHYDKIITKNDFNSSERNTKWGVHDHNLMKKLKEEIANQSEPFFSACLTLSSHEPYDVPFNSKNEIKSEEEKFLNAIRYTDLSVGNFLWECKKEAWWDNTLIILIADHGHRFPGNDSHYSFNKYKIPMLWIGGCLSEKGKIISSLGNQTDIANTLLSELRINDKKFIFGNSLFNDKIEHQSMYFFNNGFGFLTDSGKYIFDLTGEQIIEKDIHLNKTIENKGFCVYKKMREYFNYY